MEFENVSSQGSGRSIVIDFQTMNIHTGLYVRKPREEANLIIGRGNTTSHDHQGLPTANTGGTSEWMRSPKLSNA
jgi:hypothetical protein